MKLTRILLNKKHMRYMVSVYRSKNNLINLSDYFPKSSGRTMYTNKNYIPLQLQYEWLSLG